MKLHNKQEIWVNNWKDLIEMHSPKKTGDSLYYEKAVEGYNFQIRVAKEGSEYIIKTAIMSKGRITNFRMK